MVLLSGVQADAKFWFSSNVSFLLSSNWLPSAASFATKMLDKAFSLRKLKTLPSSLAVNCEIQPISRGVRRLEALVALPRCSGDIIQRPAPCWFSESPRQYTRKPFGSQYTEGPKRLSEKKVFTRAFRHSFTSRELSREL